MGEYRQIVYQLYQNNEWINIICLHSALVGPKNPKMCLSNIWIVPNHISATLEPLEIKLPLPRRCLTDGGNNGYRIFYLLNYGMYQKISIKLINIFKRTWRAWLKKMSLPRPFEFQKRNSSNSVKFGARRSFKIQKWWKSYCCFCFYIIICSSLYRFCSI